MLNGKVIILLIVGWIKKTLQNEYTKNELTLSQTI